MAANEEIIRLRNSSEEVVNEDTIVQALSALAQRINAAYQDKDPIILCVMNGGLFFTSELTRRIDVPFILDYLHATRYENDTKGRDLIWKCTPQSDLTGRHVLVLDDILDEGYTLKSIQRALSIQKPASLKTAVLTVKQHDRRVQGVQVEYQGISVPDRYVFGCGMDLKGYYRNLSSIYALSEHPY